VRKQQPTSDPPYFAFSSLIFAQVENAVYKTPPKLHRVLDNRNASKTPRRKFPDHILTPWQVADRFSEDSPIGALAKFTHLETFVIYCQTITGFYDYILDRTYEFGDLLSLQIFGLSIMNACPTLRRADIGSDVSPATDIWYPGSKKKELACTLTRSPDGDVESVCATRFDFHAVGMFW
jgi:hypothetical protein